MKPWVEWLLSIALLLLVVSVIVALVVGFVRWFRPPVKPAGGEEDSAGLEFDLGTPDQSTLLRRRHVRHLAERRYTGTSTDGHFYKISVIPKARSIQVVCPTELATGSEAGSTFSLSFSPGRWVYELSDPAKVFGSAVELPGHGLVLGGTSPKGQPFLVIAFQESIVESAAALPTGDFGFVTFAQNGSVEFGAINNVNWNPNSSKIGPDGPDAPKIILGPDPPKNAPDAPKNGPDAPKNGPDAPKNGPDGPDTPKNDPHLSHIDPDLSHIGPVDGAKIGPVDGAKIGPVDGAKIGPVDGAKIGAVDGLKIIGGLKVGPQKDCMVFSETDLRLFVTPYDFMALTLPRQHSTLLFPQMPSHDFPFPTRAQYIGVATTQNWVGSVKIEVNACDGALTVKKTDGGTLLVTQLTPEKSCPGLFVSQDVILLKSCKAQFADEWCILNADHLNVAALIVRK